MIHSGADLQHCSKTCPVLDGFTEFFQSRSVKGENIFFPSHTEPSTLREDSNGLKISPFLSSWDASFLPISIWSSLCCRFASFDCHRCNFIFAAAAISTASRTNYSASSTLSPPPTTSSTNVLFSMIRAVQGYLSMYFVT